MKKILITGGSGYVGTRLTYKLLDKDIKIVNYDISLFGDKHLPNASNYIYVKEDLRNKEKFFDVLKKFEIDVVIHLACISNDPTFELKNNISKQINYDCFESIVKLAKKAGVKKFIYASTSSVYGVSSEPDVTEEHALLPITDYNKYKGLCEPILINYLDESFEGIIIRPSTVCGYSEKMRFDLTVNILTNFAFNKGYIKVFGGSQMRPNIHIDDMCDLYDFLIFNNTKEYSGRIYNAGIENLKVIDIANLVKQVVEGKTKKKIDIIIEESQDIRSYHVNSDKIKKELKFEFKKNVKNAIEDLCDAFISGKIANSFSDDWQNIKILKKNLQLLKNFEN